MGFATKSNVVPDKFPVYVGVESTERSYGGPEEGGWYYDSVVEYHNVQWVTSLEAFEALVPKLCEAWGLRTFSTSYRTPNRWDSSACVEYTLWFGYDRPQNKSNPRPRYE